MYKKEEVTLGRAAEIAGMGIIEFKDVLRDRSIKIIVPKTSIDEIDMPSELLFLLHETEESFKEKVKLWTSIKLFEDKKLSLEQAAEFAGYSKMAFIEILGKSKVSIFNIP